MVGRFFRNASAALVFLATVAGAYFGAAALHLERIFWILVGLALVLAFAKMVGPSFNQWARSKQEQLKKGADYNRLLQVAADQTVDSQRLQTLLSQAELSVELEFSNGLTEGRRRLVAEWLAGATDTAMKPVALVVSEGDTQMLKVTAIYDGESPRVGSHWHARVLGHPALRAVFAVESIVGPRHQAILVLAYARDEQIVRMLESTAIKTSEFPSSIELERRPFTAIEDLAEEG